jgi:tetratricopeptide (TPR) repeat protein/competence protein ComGC
VLAALIAGSVGAAEPIPCRRLAVSARAADGFLEASYEFDLANLTERPVRMSLLVGVDVLATVEGLDKRLVLERAGDEVRAQVPAGWQGTLRLGLKQRVGSRPSDTARIARLPMAAAVVRVVELELPGAAVELEVVPESVVTPLPGGGQVSRFRIVPLRDGALELAWKPLPPERRIGYRFRQVQRVLASPPEFTAEAELSFTFPDAPPPAVRLRLPEGADLRGVEVRPASPWSVADGWLSVDVPAGLRGGELVVLCRVAGSTRPEEGPGALLEAPLFGCPDAERHEGRVTVTAEKRTLSIAALSRAAQVVAEEGAGQLACDLLGDGAQVLVRLVPVESPVRVQVQSHYEVSPFQVRGTHRVTAGDARQETTLLLPAGHFVRAVKGVFPVEWFQDGDRLRITQLAPSPGMLAVEVSTEWLTGEARRFALGPLAVEGAASSEYALALKPAADIGLKTSGPAEAWRTAPQGLPQFLRNLAPEIAYQYRDQPLAVQVEVLPLTAELSGAVQDHVTVGAERIRRRTLFALEASRRPARQVDLAVPAGVTVESVEGPLIEGYDLADGGGRLAVRFVRPQIGPFHFQVVSARGVVPGSVRLEGISLPAAPHLKGWLGIEAELGVSVRPMQDGQLNLTSVRTEAAPDYLKAFPNELVYEFLEGAWWLDLAVEAVEPLYSAEALEVARLRAGQAECTAFFNIRVQRGGLSELAFALPAGATGAEFVGLDAVTAQAQDGRLSVKLKGKQSGSLACRVDYALAASETGPEVVLEPVRLVGSREQSGLLLLTQARPDVEARLGAAPAALSAVEPEQAYPAWSYQRDQPALAAYAYRGTDWGLPLTLKASPLSEALVAATVPLAKLDTLVERGGECVHHLRLYVSNTNRQFLTLDLAALGPGARLIGTYAFGEPLKPFREGASKLQVPLFASEKAAALGLSVLDVIYTTPHGGLRPLGKQILEAPELGLNVGRLEWAVRMPEGYTLTAVGGNLGRPVEGPAPPSLAAPALHEALRLLRDYWGWPAGAAAVVLAVLICRYLYLLTLREEFWRKVLSHRMEAAVVLLIVVVLAALLMPSLSRAREESRRSSQRSDLHNVGVAISIYMNDHEGEAPPALQALFDLKYMEASALSEWPGQQVVYRRPRRDSMAAEPVAYFWPPKEGGANVLYLDTAVQWVDLSEDGQLLNPRTGALIARWTGEEAPAAAAVAFGKVGLKARELSQALEVQQRMAPAAAAPSQARAEKQQVAADELVLEAHREEIEGTVQRYKEEHGGQGPQSGEDLAPYLADSSLLPAVQRAVQRAMAMPALSTAREEARRSIQSANLHNIALGVAMYREAHGGRPPSALADLLVEGYLDDADVLSPILEGQHLYYSPVSSDAPPAAVVAYFWGPSQPGANVAFSDNAVQWVDADKEGRIINPRSGKGEVIAWSQPVIGTAQQAPAPSDRDALAADRYNLGRAYMAAGDYNRAAGQFDRALELKADYKDALRARDEARAMRRVAAKAFPADVGERAGEKPALEGDLAGIETSIERRERLAVGAQQAEELPGQAPPPRPEAVVPVLPPRKLARASLVRSAGGGRSQGALPISIEFPATPTATYLFVKPFLGRAEARLSCRPVSRAAAGLGELALAAAALVVYLAARRRRPRAAVTLAAAILAAAAVLQVSGPAILAQLWGSAAVAMAACLAVEATARTTMALRRRQMKEADA